MLEDPQLLPNVTREQHASQFIKLKGPQFLSTIAFELEKRHSP